MSKENCNEYLHFKGESYPRTCKECGLGPCKHKPPGKPLKDFTLEQYKGLEKLGLLNQFYPEATGNYEKDTGNKIDKTEELKSLLFEALQIIDKIQYWPDHRIMVDKFKEKIKNTLSDSEIDD